MNIKQLAGRTLNSVSKFFLGRSISSDVWGWENPQEWDRTTLLKQFKRYTFAIVGSIAEEAAKADFKAVAKYDLTKPVMNSEFIKLLEKPNEDASQFQFLELHFTFMDLAGESFWYMPLGQRSLKPREIYLLRPDKMDVAIDRNSEVGTVAGYVMTKSNGEKITFDKEEILHFKTPNPLNQYRGLGVVQAAKIYIETEEYGSKFTRNSIYNSGRPSGIVNIKGTVDKDEFDALKRRFKSEYTGTENAGKTMFLKGAQGIDYQKLGMEISEVALRDMKDMNKEDLLFMFRTSKSILGVTDDVNRANAQEQRIVFRQQVVMPRLDRFIDHINAFALQRFGATKDIIKYSYPEVKTNKELLEEHEAGLNKWLTINEVRIERGMKPIDGGDVLYVPLNLIPLSKDVGAKMFINEKKAFDEKHGRKDTSLKESKLSEKEIKRREVNDEKARRRALAENFRVLLFKNQRRWEEIYLADIVKEFKKQKKEIFANINKENKTTLVIKDIDQWVFNRDDSKRRLIGDLVPLVSELIKEQSKQAFALTDNPDNDLVFSTDVTKFIRERVDKFADSTNDETIKDIKESISQGILDGESIAKLKKRITDIYKTATTTRAERIARTETSAASNEAALLAYKQSPEVKGKEWLAEPTACEFCKALDGKIIKDLNSPFVPFGESVQGEEDSIYTANYTDINYPPLHPQCECTIVPV